MAGVEKLRFFPVALESGSGCTLVEVGGRELLDLTATWTAVGLGHGHPKVVEAMVKAAQNPPGAGLSAVHGDAVGLAEEAFGADRAQASGGSTRPCRQRCL